ncbi:hypothetical protein AB0I16_11595 [Streptomyces sp. NPDC050703]|uniref:hypothetical protein n=1 Tax=Streptomyces sp. NPDC050703 TaxID=3157218 RepID=UPI00342C4F66
MASKTARVTSPRAVRQLRRVRAFYLVAALLWAATTAWTGRQSAGSREMWLSALLLAVFSALLLAASVWLRRLRPADPAGPAHRTATRAATPRRSHA